MLTYLRHGIVLNISFIFMSISVVSSSLAAFARNICHLYFLNIFLTKMSVLLIQGWQGSWTTNCDVTIPKVFAFAYVIFCSLKTTCKPGGYSKTYKEVQLRATALILILLSVYNQTRKSDAWVFLPVKRCYSPQTRKLCFLSRKT